jgi:hypothetical protein
MSNKPDIDQVASFKKELPVNITDADKAERGARAITCYQEIVDIEASKAEAVAGFNADLKDKRKEMRTLCAAATTGQELAQVDCVEEFNYTLGTVSTRRCDTNEALEERAMTLDERNERLPGMGDNVTHIPAGVDKDPKKRGKHKLAAVSDEESADATH